MGRFVGIDYGTKYIGIALSDEDQLFSAASPAFRVKKLTRLVPDFAKFLTEVAPDTEKLIIGHPTGLDGKPTKLSKQAEAFAQEISQLLAVPFILYNETYTSQLAAQHGAKDEANHSKAAQLLLQEYLDFQKTGI